MLFSTSIIFPQKKKKRLAADISALQVFICLFCCWSRSWEWNQCMSCLLCYMYGNIHVWGCGFLQSGILGMVTRSRSHPAAPFAFEVQGCAECTFTARFYRCGVEFSIRTILPYWGSFFATKKELWVNPSKQPQIKHRPEHIQGQTGFPKSPFSFGRKKNAKCVNIWWAHHLMKPQTLLCQRSLKAAGEIFPVMFISRRIEVMWVITIIPQMSESWSENRQRQTLLQAAPQHRVPCNPWHGSVSILATILSNSQGVFPHLFSHKPYCAEPTC